MPTCLKAPVESVFVGIADIIAEITGTELTAPFKFFSELSPSSPALGSSKEGTGPLRSVRSVRVVQ